MDVLKMEMAVLTVKDREILDKIFFISGNSTVTWDLKDKDGQPAANGVYFVRFRITGGSTKEEKIFKVVILE
jgi:hypothetical protein